MDCTICAYLGFENVVFDVDDSITAWSELSLEDTRALEKIKLENVFMGGYLHELVWNEMPPGGVAAFARVEKFSELVSELGSCHYEFGDGDVCEVTKIDAQWVDEERTQISVSFELYSEVDATIIASLDLIEGEGDFAGSLQPSASDLEGYFLVDEVLPA